MKAPRNQPFAEKPGDYKIASRVYSYVINPGDTLKIDQFITGYGEIYQAKIIGYFSPDTFDTENTRIVSGLIARFEENGMHIKWGKSEDKIRQDDSIVMNISGWQAEGWKETTSAFDLSNDSNIIATEVKLEHAPIHYKLKTNNHLKPGAYHLSFYLTYFNGDSWCCVEERIDFKVQNPFERYNGVISALAAIALVVAIAADGLIPLFKQFHEIGKFVESIRHEVASGK